MKLSKAFVSLWCFVFFIEILFSSCNSSSSGNGPNYTPAEVRMMAATGYYRDSSSFRHIERIDTNSMRFVPIEKFSIPAKNCTGKNIVRLTHALSKTTSVEYSISVNAQIESYFFKFLSFSLGSEFGISHGESIEKSMSIEVEALPFSNVEYEYTWREVWRTGDILLSNLKGQTKKIPFECRIGLDYKQISVKELPCD